MRPALGLVLILLLGAVVGSVYQAALDWAALSPARAPAAAASAPPGGRLELRGQLGLDGEPATIDRLLPEAEPGELEGQPRDHADGRVLEVEAIGPRTRSPAPGRVVFGVAASGLLVGLFGLLVAAPVFRRLRPGADYGYALAASDAEPGGAAEA